MLDLKRFESVNRHVRIDQVRTRHMRAPISNGAIRYFAPCRMTIKAFRERRHSTEGSRLSWYQRKMGRQGATEMSELINSIGMESADRTKNTAAEAGYRSFRLGRCKMNAMHQAKNVLDVARRLSAKRTYGDYTLAQYRKPRLAIIAP